MIKPCKDAARIEAPSDLSIGAARSLKCDIERHLAEGASLTCDASGVERVDLSFVQIAVSAQRSFAQRRLSFRLLDAPPMVVEAFDRAAIPGAIAKAILHGAD